MAKLYDSPTANLYALLADEADRGERKARAATSKGNQPDLTPKERAEAKAVEHAERKAKREADQAAKREEAARKARAASLELVTDDSGFSQQRHQRIKEARVTPAAESPKQPHKGDNKGDGKGPKGPKNNNKGPRDQPKEGAVAKTGGNKGFGGQTQSPKTPVRHEPKGPKGEVKGEAKSHYNNKPARGREFDKHSQGVVSRKPAAKKGGHGKGNWDNPIESVPVGTTAEEAASSTTVAAKVTEVDETADATPAAEGAAKTETATDADKQVDEDDDSNLKTLDEYLAAQAAKQKELESKFAQTQPRGLSEDEKKALAKFTQVENTKGPATKEAKPAATPAAAPAAKSQKKQPVVLEVNITHPPREGARRGRFDGNRENRGRFEGNRDQNRDQKSDQNRDQKRDQNRDQNRGEQKKGRVAKPARLPKGNFDTQFPTLG